MQIDRRDPRRRRCQGGRSRASLFELGERPTQPPLLPQRDALAATPAGAGLSAIGRQILEAQKLLLAEPAAEGAAGRLGSAGRVAANVLRHQAGRSTPPTWKDCCRPACSPATPHRWRQRSTGSSSGLAETGARAAPGTLAAQPPDATLRVDVERIDTLVRLTGELLIAKNALGHSAQLAQDGADAAPAGDALKNQHRCSERLVGELQRVGAQLCASCRCITPSSAFRGSCARWPPRSASRPAW